MITKSRELWNVVNRWAARARERAFSLGELFLRTWNILVFLGLVWLSLVLVFAKLSPSSLVTAMIGMDSLLLGIALKDLQEQRVPNRITYPIMAAGVARAVVFRDPTFLMYWAVFWMFWSARFMGAGDAKLLMALFGLWPDIHLAYAVAAMILVTGIPYLVYKYRGQWRTAVHSLGWRLVTLRILPSPGEFQDQAVPYAFSFCLAGGVYLYLRFVML